MTTSGTASTPVGAVVHWAHRYDWLVTLLTLGRERRFRETLLKPAKLVTGETVLDIGCGTGTLALVAKRQVGPTGAVHGIDASPSMIALARRKAVRAGLAAGFEVALAQELPYQDACFDVVLSTVMLHHLPRAGREECIRETHRVLKPGGRMIAVDFVRIVGKGLFSHFRPRDVDPRELIALVSGGGLTVTDSGAIGMWGLQFVVGRRA